MMKFLIEIEGRTAVDLIHSLDEVRKTLVSGAAHLNVGGCTNALLMPANAESREEFYQQWSEAHPRATESWPK